MIRLKKYFPVAILSFLMLFFSCQEDEDKGPVQADLAVCLRTITNDWQQAVRDTAANTLNVVLKDRSRIANAENAAQQARQIRAAVDAGCRVLIIEPEEVNISVINEMIANDVDVILFEKELDVDYKAFVSGDNAGSGINAADYMLGKGASNIVAFRVSQDETTSDLRINSFLSRIRESAFGTGATIVTVTTIKDYTASSAKTETLRLLANDPTIDAIYAQDDDIAMGVIDALNQFEGDTNLEVIVGCGGKQGYLKIIQDNPGLYLATTLYSPKMINLCITMGVNLLNGISPDEKRIIVPATVIDLNNVDQYIE